MKQDIQHIDAIEHLVDSFYAKVDRDKLLGPIFNRVIGDSWDDHLSKMYRFWQTVLLEEKTYYGSPFFPHADLPVEKKHFDRWLKLFEQTLDENFEGETTEEARWRAHKMAEMFRFKIERHRNNNSKPLM